MFSLLVVAFIVYAIFKRSSSPRWIANTFGLGGQTTAEEDNDRGTGTIGTVDAAGIPLYERPDGLSTIVRRLPANTVVTFCGTEGTFLRVSTDDAAIGYASISACRPLRAAGAREEHA